MPSFNLNCPFKSSLSLVTFCGSEGAKVSTYEFWGEIIQVITGRQKTALYLPRRAISEATNPASTLNSDFLALGLRESKIFVVVV